MTNGEKYKTAHLRSEAFHKFCDGNTTEMGLCDPYCKLFHTKDDTNGYCTHCEFFWLELEVEGGNDENP